MIDNYDLNSGMGGGDDNYLIINANNGHESPLYRRK
jgi:hypothetical protein